MSFMKPISHLVEDTPEQTDEIQLEVSSPEIPQSQPSPCS